MLDTPLEQLDAMARIPDILTACDAAGLKTGHGIVDRLARQFSLERRSTRSYVSAFLNGLVLANTPGGEPPGLTLTASRIARSLGVPESKAFAAFATPGYGCPQPPEDMCAPLSSYDFLHNKLRPLEDALRGQGIVTRRHLVKALIKKGASRAHASNQLRDFLDGRIFKAWAPQPGAERKFTRAAKLVCRAARIDPEIAFARLRKGGTGRPSHNTIGTKPKTALPEDLRDTIGLPPIPPQEAAPTPNNLFLPFRYYRSLDDFELLRTTLRPLRNALKDRRIDTLGELANGVVAKGANPRSVYNLLTEALEGRVFHRTLGTLTVTAKHLCDVAGLEPEIAFASLVGLPRPPRPAARLLRRSRGRKAPQPQAFDKAPREDLRFVAGPAVARHSPEMDHK